MRCEGDEKTERIKAVIQAVSIGDLGIAASPSEAFTEIGLEIKDRSPVADDELVRLMQRLT